MTTRTAETSPLIYARLAGFLYLLLLPLGIFGILYVPSTLIVPGDAATTATNIMASDSLFRLSIVSALLVQLVNIFVVLLLLKFRQNFSNLKIHAAGSVNLGECWPGAVWECFCRPPGNAAPE